MATRSTISIINNDNTITSVYCHWDGYIAYNGKLLLLFYNNEAQVRALLEMGNISILDKTINKPEDIINSGDKNGFTIFYGRDRCEKNTESITFKNLADFKQHFEEYNYVFYKNKWHLYDQKSDQLKDLIEVIKTEYPEVLMDIKDFIESQDNYKIIDKEINNPLKNNWNKL